MAYNTPETVADYLARFQMEITHRGKGTFTPDHVKYSLTIASGGKDFFTTFESNPHTMPFSRGFPTTRSGWKKELAECDIDPEAVSVDSEAHDMENGRDGLDGNAPEKDAPEKDDRDAQPPVDTDNR